MVFENRIMTCWQKLWVTDRYKIKGYLHVHLFRCPSVDEWVHIFMLFGFNEGFYLASFLFVNVCIKTKQSFKMHLKAVAVWSDSLGLVSQQPNEILGALSTFCTRLLWSTLTFSLYICWLSEAQINLSTLLCYGSGELFAVVKTLKYSFQTIMKA